jgi:hypothetical protein
VSEPSAVHPGITPITDAYFDPGTGGFTDDVIVFQPAAQLTIDPETRSPHSDQFSIGFERQLRPDIAFSATYIHKDGRDYIGWTDTTGIYEPGTATLANGQSVPTYSLLTPPEDQQFLLTNRDELFLRYNGLLLTLEKRWSERWQSLVSYSVSETFGLQATSGFGPGAGQLSTTGGWNGFGRDPNDYTNATGPLNLDRTHMFRVQAAVEIPRVGILVGANFQHLTGAPWAAFANVRLPQGGRGILTEPKGTRRLSYQSLLDVRLSKIFRVGKEGRIEVLADILNVLNDTAEVQLVTNNLFSGNFEKPNRWVDPRRAMIGVKLSF